MPNIDPKGKLVVVYGPEDYAWRFCEAVSAKNGSLIHVVGKDKRDERCSAKMSDRIRLYKSWMNKNRLVLLPIFKNLKAGQNNRFSQWRVVSALPIFGIYDNRPYYENLLCEFVANTGPGGLANCPFRFMPDGDVEELPR
jgi:hypothetical protein